MGEHSFGTHIAPTNLANSMTSEYSLIEVWTRLTDGISRSTLFIRSRLHSVNDPSGYGIGETFDLIQRHRVSLTAPKTTSIGG